MAGNNVTRSDITKSDFFSENPELASTDLARLVNETLDRFPVQVARRGVQAALFNKLERFGEATGIVDPNNHAIDTSGCEGMRVLDLACGGDNLKAENLRDREYFRPWFCRALSIIGLDVTGVDILFPSYEFVQSEGRKRQRGIAEDGWRFEQRDLTDPNALDRTTFPDASFEAVNCTYFIGSPQMRMDDPAMVHIGFSAPERYGGIVTNMRSSVARLLVEGGKFVCNFELETKCNGELLFQRYLKDY